MLSAVLSPLPVPDVSGTDSEVIDITFDAITLRITVELHESKDKVRFEFEEPRGFRVLDEGDLLEFWKGANRSKGILFKVESGGWLELELTRQGFVGTQPGAVTEYLVSGVDVCVSVLALGPPSVLALR